MRTKKNDSHFCEKKGVTTTTTTNAQQQTHNNDHNQTTTMMTIMLLYPSIVTVLLLLLVATPTHSFQPIIGANNGVLKGTNTDIHNSVPSNRLPTRADMMTNGNNGSPVQEYKNLATTVLSNFMQKEPQVPSEGENGLSAATNPVDTIDFSVPKIRKLPIDKLATKLDRELYEKEWFVTGNVNPMYFDLSFEFQDPDVKLSGIEGEWLCV